MPQNRNLKLKSDLEHAVNQHQSVQATVVQMHEENQDLRIQMHKDCKALEDALATADVEHEQRLADQKALYAKLVSSFEERAVKADENAKEQKLMFMGMRSQLDDMKREIATVTRPSANSADVDILQSEWEAKVDALERSLLAKESEIETLDSNAKTLQQRYKDGKLVSLGLYFYETRPPNICRTSARRHSCVLCSRCRKLFMSKTLWRRKTSFAGQVKSPIIPM